MDSGLSQLTNFFVKIQTIVLGNKLHSFPYVYKQMRKWFVQNWKEIYEFQGHKEGNLYNPSVTLNLDVEFPNDYPSGCLLGCVDLIDCLSQKQFKDQVSKEYFFSTDAWFASLAVL